MYKYNLDIQIFKPFIIASINKTMNTIIVVKLHLSYDHNTIYLLYIVLYFFFVPECIYYMRDPVPCHILKIVWFSELNNPSTRPTAFYYVLFSWILQLIVDYSSLPYLKHVLVQVFGTPG